MSTVSLKDLEDMFTLDKAKTAYDDPSAAIIAASFVESSLRKALVEKLPRYNNKIEDNVFRRGALTTFYNRIWVAYAIDLFGSKTVKNLDLIREIRNEFAHWKEKTDFNTTKIKTKCGQITLVTRATEIIDAGLFITEDEWPPRTPRDRYVLSCILYWNVFMEMGSHGEFEQFVLGSGPIKGL